MISFTSLAPVWRYTVMGVLFAADICMLELCLYKFNNRGRFLKILAESGIFALGVILLAYIAASTCKGSTVFEIGLPVTLILLFAAFEFVFAAAGTVRERKKSKGFLSPLSVKQALDNLDSGICFVDKNDRIILINRAMVRLISSVSGSVPQAGAQIDSVLEGLNKSGSDGLYFFPGGTVWQIGKTVLTQKNVEGIVQINAHEVTDFYTANEKLKRDNETLAKTNGEMQQMYENLADRIREQETLNLKIRIHNDIGRSLIDISDMMNSARGGDVKNSLERLQNAVSYFAQYDRAPEDFDEIAAKARSMNVTLTVIGTVDGDSEAGELIITACDECITNCVYHAKGDEVRVTITAQENFYTAVFTNNGTPPEGEIKEGGGLSSLRRKVETAGGTMRIAYSPEFALVLTLPKGELK